MSGSAHKPNPKSPYPAHTSTPRAREKRCIPKYQTPPPPPSFSRAPPRQFYLSRAWLPAITSHKPRSAGGSSAVFGFFRTMLDGGLIFFYIRTHLVLFHFPLDRSILIKHMFLYQFASTSVLDFLPRGWYGICSSHFTIILILLID